MIDCKQASKRQKWSAEVGSMHVGPTRMLPRMKQALPRPMALLQPTSTASHPAIGQLSTAAGPVPTCDEASGSRIDCRASRALITLVSVLICCSITPSHLSVSKSPSYKQEGELWRSAFVLSTHNGSKQVRIPRLDGACAPGCRITLHRRPLDRRYR